MRYPDVGENLLLPQLTFVKRVPVGRILFVVRAGGERKVIEKSEVLISPRRKEVMVQLDDGQTVILTQRAGVPRPGSVDGVLRLNSNGSMDWVSHRELVEFGSSVERETIAVVAANNAAKWSRLFRFVAEPVGEQVEILGEGLRPPQLGALHAIGAHWSTSSTPGTVVMPTGTGKTETLLATVTSYSTGRTLVVVPSNVLREQTASKFATWGLLKKLGHLREDAPNPVVGIIEARPKDDEDLSIFEDCNVVVSTMAALTGGTAAHFAAAIASKVETLVVDEAHHIAAKGWSDFRSEFINKTRILQFTATPYRRDGQLVDGHVIYDYPLRRAQQDGYFKPITFQPVYAETGDVADHEIASAALRQLRVDVGSGLDHLLMVRCNSIKRAEFLRPLYQRLGAQFAPVVISSETPDAKINLARLKSRESRIAICVNMLGEGFDLPQLKIAAVHDTHKSLAVLLQFTGRFTIHPDANPTAFALA